MLGYLGMLPLLGGFASAQQWGPWHGVGPFEHLLGHANLDERHEPERQLSEMKHGRLGPDLGRVYRGEERVDARWHEIAGGSTAFDVGAIASLMVFKNRPDAVENAGVLMLRTGEAIPRGRGGPVRRFRG